MKFALTADWHLCSRHLGVSKRGPDYTDAALSAIETAHNAGCKIILNGGDTFHDKRPTSANVAALMMIDAVLLHYDMTMYVIDGDHDAAEPSWWATLLPERTQGPGIVSINNREVKLPDGTRVWGQPPCDAETFKALLESFPTPGPDIVLWHGAIREFCGYPNPFAFSVEDIPLGKFRAILCGDQHKPHQFSVAHGMIVGYPGATELRGRDETLNQRSISIFDTADLTKPVALPIKTRPAHAYQIRSTTQLEEVAGKLRALPKDPWPMIFVRYDRDVPEVKATIRAALNNPDAILRAAPATEIDFSGVSLFGNVSDQFEHKKLEDFLPQYFPQAGPLRSLALALCSPDVDHKELIDAYVDAQQLA